MATPRKTTRSTAAKSAEAAPKPKRATTPRKTAKTIRNLRGCVVHLRLGSQKDPYRVELFPRGSSGDVQVIPASLSDDGTFLKGVDVLFEIITPAEAQEVEAQYGPTGYLGRTDAPQVVRDEDTTIATMENWDGKGRMPQDRTKRTAQGKQMSERGEHGEGQNFHDFPGSDQALHASLRQQVKAGQSAMPPEFQPDRRVAVERVRDE